jgi:hypothetical protein
MEDLGEGDILPARDQRLHERTRIDLAADRPIGPDRRDVAKFGKVEGAPGNAVRGVLAKRAVEGVTTRENLAA